MDFLFIILGNLHRLVRQKRRPPPPAAPPRTPRSRAERAFLTRSVFAALVLFAVIGLLWTML